MMNVCTIFFAIYHLVGLKWWTDRQPVSSWPFFTWFYRWQILNYTVIVIFICPQQLKNGPPFQQLKIGPRTSKEICKQSIISIWRINKMRLYTSKKGIEACRTGTCCLCFCVWGHTSQYCTPVCLPKSDLLKWFFSALLDACSPPLCFVVGMYFTLFSCRDLDGCQFFEKRYRAPSLSSFCKMHLPGHLSTKGRVCYGQCDYEG